MSERFYVNCPLTVGPIELSGSEAHHLATVCRLGAGDEVLLFNGDGSEYPARVTTVARRVVVLDVLRAEAVSRELPFHLEIAAPVPKGDRAQFLVEKLTELGVTVFVPLLCDRAVINPREGKLERLTRHVIEASKQCGRNVLMQLAVPIEWARYCRDTNPGEVRLLGDSGSHDAWPCEILPERIRCAVGPEGGFTAGEIEAALEKDWLPIALGSRTLRIETAAIAMAAAAITHERSSSGRARSIGEPGT